MSVGCVLLAVAVAVLSVNSAPTDTVYFLANALSTISNEVGLTASTTANGISFAIDGTASSKRFAIAVDESKFVIGTEDKTSAKKTDKTASKKPKRYFLKRTTGIDDYPEFTVTDTKQISNAIPKVSSSKDPKSAADNDKVSSKKTDNAAPKKPKLYFMNRTTVTDDFPSTIVADKAPTAKKNT